MGKMEKNRCPNCNAPLVYDSERKIYKCEYCRTEFRDDTKARAAEEPAEKKVIYEYHHINIPAEDTSAKKTVQNRPTGCLRVFLLVLGIFCALMGAAGFSTKYIGMSIVFLAIGIWLLVITLRKR